VAPSPPELEQDPQVQQLLRALRERAGGYLRNVDHRAGVACQVCRTPVSGGVLCWQCDGQRSRFGTELADLVVPVVYGGHNDQSERLLYGYKEPGSERPGDQRRALVQAMFIGVAVFHASCIVAAASGQQIGAVMAVPSTKQRPSHPLPQVTAHLYPDVPRLTATAVGPQPKRDVIRGRFQVGPRERAEGQHVLVVDDTWTTGAKTQSMALSLRELGATRVTILVLARWLSPGTWGPTDDYLARNVVDNYDPRVCPVTGATCPT
jgi:hypothetical protein